MEFTQGVRFDTLPISPELLQAVRRQGLEISTPVQAGCIPLMLNWQDVIAKAPTGTGKTLAFGIPIVQHIDPDDDTVQAVILSPTRELAIQIHDELCLLAESRPGVRCIVLYGGAPIGKQLEELKRKPQIVVATPGRLSDHMKRRSVRVDTARTVVLDEADRMLDMGFVHDVTRLLDRMNLRKNLGLFSATISREVMDIAWVYQRDAEEITVREDEENKPDIKQFRMEVSDKADAIAAILRETGFDRCMVFCNTKGTTERIAKFLQMRGVDAECIHGDIPQKQRERVMDKFRQGKLQVFVSTDVAARGIDVDDVDIVFNADVPDENQDYIHRIGRTGRARRQGVAVTLVGDYPSKLRIDEIAKRTGNQIIPVRFDADGKLTTE
ncbi:MAG: DEAD/DEAH box helicase [Oscillibacter sp.]|nr:DEAD/DEAH box helicase [Oscillibacter sp.]